MPFRLSTMALCFALAAASWLLPTTVRAWQAASQQAGDPENQADDTARERILKTFEQINGQVDQVDPSERANERRVIQVAAQSLQNKQWSQLHRTAEGQALQAPTAQLRQLWRDLAEALKPQAEAAQGRTQKLFEQIDQFLAQPFDAEKPAKLLAAIRQSGGAEDSQLALRLKEAEAFLQFLQVILEMKEANRFDVAVPQVTRLRNTPWQQLAPPGKLLQSLAENVAEAQIQHHRRIAKEVARRLSSAASEEQLAGFESWLGQPSQHGLHEDSARDHIQYRGIASQWRRVLRSRDAGKLAEAISEAKQCQQQIGQLNASTELIVWIKSQVELLEMQEAAAAKKEIARIDELLQKAKSVEDLSEVRRSLQKTPSTITGDARADISHLQQDLNLLVGVVQAVNRDNPAGLWSAVRGRHSLSPHRWSQWTNEWETRMILQTIRDAGQFDEIAPQEGERISQMLLREADAATEKSDWSQVYRLLLMYKNIYQVGAVSPSRSSTVWLDQELAACEQFMLAQSHEKTGDVAAAVTAYKDVLTYLSKRVPRAEAEQRIIALRREHPKAFEPPATKEESPSQPKPAQTEKKETPPDVKPRAEPGRAPGEPMQLHAHVGAARCVALSPDAKWLASGGQDMQIFIWDLTANKLHCHFQHDIPAIRPKGLAADAKHGTLLSITFSPDGQRLVSGASYNPVAIVWDIGKQEALQRLDCSMPSVRSARFSPDGKHVICAGSDMIVFDVASGRALRRIGEQSDNACDVAYSADGTRLVSCGHDRTIRLWDAGNGRELRRLFEYPFEARLYLYSVGFTHDGKYVATGGLQGLRLIDLQTGELATQLGDAKAAASRIALASQGNFVACAHRNHPVRVYSVGDGKMVQQFEPPSSVEGLAISADGSQIATADVDGIVRVRKLPASSDAQP